MARLSRTALCSAVAIAAVSLSVRSARAEDAETRTAARDLATQGGQAFDAGHYEQARDFFSRAYELVHAPSIALMQARSLAKLGQLLEAIDVYEQTAHTQLLPGAPDAYSKAVEAARDEVEEVRSRVPRLKITLQHASESERPEVTIDDKPTPAALLGVDRPMNPGSHRVALWVSGQNRATRELGLEEGKSYSVELDAAPDAAPAAERAMKPQQIERSSSPPATAPASSTVARSNALPTTRVLGYAGIGIGVIGLGIGTYTGLVALHHKSQLDDLCHPACPASSADELSGFRNNRTASWVSYAVGVAGVTTGILLLTLGDPRHETVALGVVPGGIRIGGRL